MTRKSTIKKVKFESEYNSEPLEIPILVFD